jgi:DNA-binding transcriptional ArsR family regulator
VQENRPVLTDPEVLEALAHPVRLDVLTYLISDGPATASVCARAVGDSPSNCSYHLRALARHGLVESVSSPDARQRPWRATITGFRTADADSELSTPEAQGAAAVLSASVALDQRLLRDYLTHRDQTPERWREADQYMSYTVRVTPSELSRLGAQLDALIRPLIAALREAPPDDAQLVHVSLYAFPRTGSPWNRPRR